MLLSKLLGLLWIVHSLPLLSYQFPHFIHGHYIKAKLILVVGPFRVAPIFV